MPLEREIEKKEEVKIPKFDNILHKEDLDKLQSNLPSFKKLSMVNKFQISPKNKIVKLINPD